MPRIFLFTCYLLTCSSSLAADKRPNIVFLLTDDQTTYSLGCYGNRYVRTPNLDRLAARGVRFTNAYTPSPVFRISQD